MKNKYIISTIKPWNIENAKKLVSENSDTIITLIEEKRDFNFKNVTKIKPRFIFLPHWSWVIPREIYDNFECIIFHMTDLPFGRGGTPLQNLIERSFSKTKISAIRAVKKIDAGPIYLKKNLSLKGSAEEIYKRASKIIFNEMIPYIIKKEPKPKPQKGKIFTFIRRKPKDSALPIKADLNSAYNYIRMLDAKDYPHAFIETQRLRIEFTNAVKKRNCIEAKVCIKPMEKE